MYTFNVRQMEKPVNMVIPAISEKTLSTYWGNFACNAFLDTST